MRSFSVKPIGRLIVFIAILLIVGAFGQIGVVSMDGSVTENDGSPSIYYMFSS